MQPTTVEKVSLYDTHCWSLKKSILKQLLDSSRFQKVESTKKSPTDKGSNNMTPVCYKCCPISFQQVNYIYLLCFMACKLHRNAVISKSLSSLRPN